MERRLYRSNTDKMFAGVCGGLGKYLDVDPTLIRLLFVLAVLAGFGSGVVFYLILMIIMPLEGQAPVSFAPPTTPARAPEPPQAPDPAAPPQ